MEKMNEQLENFLREISPYSGKAYPFIVALNKKYSYVELVQKRTFLEELIQLGFVKATDEIAPVASSIDRYSMVEFPDFFSLTSKGETYFDEIDKQETAEIATRVRQWRHDYKVACFSFLGGGIAGGLVTLLLHFMFDL